MQPPEPRSWASGVEVVTVIAGAGGMQSLLVRAGTGRGATKQARANDHGLTAQAFVFNRSPQTGRTRAHHQGVDLPQWQFPAANGDALLVIRRLATDHAAF